MSRKPRAPQQTDLISTITDTIANHPRLSAAVAFQMGVLLGQVLNNRGATLSALKRQVEAAPAALASALPAFGLFDSPATAPKRKKAARKTASRKRRKA